MREVCDAIGIEAETIHKRAEEAGKDTKLRESFDVATARAVANMNILAEYCIPLIKMKGYFAAMKGPSLPDELEYAFSEFFGNEAILDKIGEIGDNFYLENWSLDRIISYREGMHWREYIELVEYITNRSTYWEVDFSDIENLIELFVESIKECQAKEGTVSKRTPFVPAYTFRICIGSKVLDIVCNHNVRKLKTYKGVLSAKTQNSLSIQFLIGDSTSERNRISESIFLPVKIFDGKTNYIGGNSYLDIFLKSKTSECKP